MRSEVLAIDEGRYLAWVEMAKNVKVTVEQLAAPEAVTKLIPARKSVGNVAVITLNGYLTQKPNLLSLLFGGTSVLGFTREVVAAVQDSSVGAVVVSADSPGGEVFGLMEAASVLRAVRGSKPIIAVADPLAASAAYWLASQADEVVSTPSGLTGSVGVIGVHVDQSKALEQMGIAVSLITYGRRKAEGAPEQPLSDEARAGIQERVDYYGRAFEADVAKGRRISVEKVRSDFGEGSVMVADKALKAGLVDRIDTLDEVVAQVARGYRPASMPPLGPARAYDPAELAFRARVAGLDSLE